MQDHDKTDESLKMREKSDILESQLSMLKTQVLSLSENNKVLKDKLASPRLMQTAAGHEMAKKPVVKKRGGFPSAIGKWWLSERVSVFAVAAIGGLCVWMVRTDPDRNNNYINENSNMELIAARDRVSKLETEVETHAKNNPAGLAKGLEIAIVAKDEEIYRSRIETLRMRKEIDGLRSELSSLTKGKDREIARREESIAWMEKKNLEKIAKIKLKMDKEIKSLQEKIRWLNKIKAVAIPGLINALDHQDVSSQNIIARTLAELTGKSLGTNQEKWYKWWKKNRLNFIRR